MEGQIQELKREIDLLNAKVESLENKEKKRKTLSYVRLLLKVAIILFSIYGLFWSYNYLVEEVPKILQEKVKDAFTTNLIP